MNSGIPYAEAMALETPAVATPNVGARYVLNDGRAGVLVELQELGRACPASRRQRAAGAIAGGRVGPGSRGSPCRPSWTGTRRPTGERLPGGRTDRSGIRRATLMGRGLPCTSTLVGRRHVRLAEP